MTENTNKSNKKKPVPRNREPEKRQVMRAGSENADVIKLSMLYFDIADLIESRLETMLIHNDERKRLQTIMYRAKKLAKAGGVFLDPKNTNALKTIEQCEVLFNQVIASERAKKAKETSRTARSDDKIWFV